MRFNLFLALGLSVCLVNVSWAQRSEIGFGLGTFNYTGDLVRTYDFSFSRPAATVFYRSNLSKVVSFRAGMTGGFLGASDRKPIDAARAYRVTVNNFLASGGDGFSLFAQGTQPFDAGLDLDALETYLKLDPQIASNRITVAH